ncbi:pyrimidodiazepine synthase-like [Odontomachus brunneus]|uniref:pyrimidodiazepine synthase-like n=1 Tax=Odontomachus brunneus TaxID=486640 RepID=UPI0013F1F5EF|nr:pyrimidodiazepine synthase-like [Odontomachus brunneus]
MSTKHLSTGSIPPPLVRGKLRLYSMRFCPYAQRILLVLDAKQIPYDVVNINLKHKPEWFIEKSPLEIVPCIELEGGHTLYESLIIADYLDEAYPQNRPLYSCQPFAKARDKLLIERFKNVINIMYKLNKAPALDQGLFNELLAGLEFYERELVKRATAFFGGRKPGMLDFMIWPWCERADAMKILRGEQYVIPRDRLLRLFEWRAAMKEDIAVCGSFLEPEIHAKYLRSHLAGVPEYD